MSTQSKSSLFGLLVLVIAAMMLVACVPAQGSLGAQTAAAQNEVAVDPAREITVVGYGDAYGEPDQAQVQIGVETFSPTVSEATANNEAALEAVMESLEAAGIPSKDIQTSNYSVWAEQIYGEQGPEGIAGYRVSNMVTVVIRDITVVDEVLGAVTEAGANSIYGVNFSVADTAALQAEARAKAVADAQARAQSLAELAGVELGEPLRISEVSGQSAPYPMGGGGVMMEAAATAPGISPGQLSYQMPVQVTYAIK